MVTMDKVIALSKRRGFIFPGSEIYGGLANSYEYGPAGVELKRNIMNAWWKYFVQQRADMVGLDSSIILHPNVWKASGHVDTFSDALIDCRSCQLRTRADHLIEDFLKSKGSLETVEGKKPAELDELVSNNKIPCPSCGKHDWTKVRSFNLLFETKLGIVSDDQSLAYLRGETAQGIFVAFKNIVDSTRLRLPFGVAQLGKSFRNEITKGNFIFRTLEFEQGEIEYFFDPEAQNWETIYEDWKAEMWRFATEILGLAETNLRWRTHADEERSFYSKRTEDLEFNFPFGFKELWGLAYRTDYDLKQHEKMAKADLSIMDPTTNKKISPHVIEPAVGINRLMLAVMMNSLIEEADGKGGQRTVLALPTNLAPFKAAIFPLLANKPDLVEAARGLYDQLRQLMPIAWDDRGNIGKRYFAQDEIGTPFCITVDFQTLEDKTVTVRHRDTMKQDRLPIADLNTWLLKQLN
jgi:glycyl-tRNA synthetase